METTVDFTLTRNSKGYTIAPTYQQPVSVACSVTVRSDFHDPYLSPICDNEEHLVAIAMHTFEKQLRDALRKHRAEISRECPILTTGRLVTLNQSIITNEMVCPKVSIGLELLEYNEYTDIIYLGNDGYIHSVQRYDTNDPSERSRIGNDLTNVIDDSNDTDIRYILAKLRDVLYLHIWSIYPEYEDQMYVNELSLKDQNYFILLIAINLNAAYFNPLASKITKYRTMISEGAMCTYSGIIEDSALTRKSYEYTDTCIVGLFEPIMVPTKMEHVHYEYDIDVPGGYVDPDRRFPNISLVRSLEGNGLSHINSVHEVLGRLVFDHNTNGDPVAVWERLSDMKRVVLMTGTTDGVYCGTTKLSEMGCEKFCKWLATILGEIHGLKSIKLMDDVLNAYSYEIFNRYAATLLGEPNIKEIK